MPSWAATSTNAVLSLRHSASAAPDWLARNRSRSPSLSVSSQQAPTVGRGSVGPTPTKTWRELAAVVAEQLVVAGAIGRVDVEIAVVVVVDPVGLAGRSAGDGQADLGGDVGELPAVVAQHLGELVGRRRAAEQVDVAVAVVVAPAQAAQLVAAGLRHAQPPRRRWSARPCRCGRAALRRCRATRRDRGRRRCRSRPRRSSTSWGRRTARAAPPRTAGRRRHGRGHQRRRRRCRRRQHARARAAAPATVSVVGEFVMASAPCALRGALRPCPDRATARGTRASTAAPADRCGASCRAAASCRSSSGRRP